MWGTNGVLLNFGFDLLKTLIEMALFDSVYDFVELYFGFDQWGATYVVLWVDGVDSDTSIEVFRSTWLVEDEILCEWLDDKFDRMMDAVDAFGRDGVGGDTSIEVLEDMLFCLLKFAKASPKILFSFIKNYCWIWLSRLFHNIVVVDLQQKILVWLFPQ